jgi:hypothetical protein
MRPRQAHVFQASLGALSDAVDRFAMLSVSGRSGSRHPNRRRRLSDGPNHFRCSSRHLGVAIVISAFFRDVDGTGAYGTGQTLGWVFAVALVALGTRAIITGRKTRR